MEESVNFVHNTNDRDNGSVVEHADGHKEWILNGKRHRTDGPAVEHNDGHKEWWVNGIRIISSNKKKFQSRYPKLVVQYTEYTDGE